MTTKKLQGRLHLVLLGSATALTACQPSPPYSNQIEQLKRAGYASKADCARDWGSEDNCEDARHGGGTVAGGGAHYWGPYYSSSGRVYGYDGVTRTLNQMPSRAAVTQGFAGSESQIYGAGQGKYAAAAKATRGGFGGGGRGGFASGGG